MEYTLNVPIQVNGGESPKNLINDGRSFSLLDRELYVDNDGFLYVGHENEESEFSYDLIHTNIVSTNFGFYHGGIGYIGEPLENGNDRWSITQTGLSASNVIGEASLIDARNSSGVISGGVLEFTRIEASYMVGTAIKDPVYIVLNSNCYGTSLPDSPKNGQLFFLMQS